MSLGFGTMTDLCNLLNYTIPVLMMPSEQEKRVLEIAGYKVLRLMWVFNYSPSTLFAFWTLLSVDPPTRCTS